ncbi:hypothetical protein A3E42_00190 [Candidatus Gottesmanbacteria bacterium RIFCSPHIGHO2_12_FULL_40_13]|nr:MAG: hypothetical protein A3E42_00190 [Candidatus Gottesmanbacteria bacterium RIFCSPHIGHO2_12_FULL_40_13]
MLKTKYRRLLLIIAIFVVLFLFLLKLNSTKKREIDKIEEGSREVAVQLNPREGEKVIGESFEVMISLSKRTDRDIKISGAQAELLASDGLKFDSAECLEPFNGLPYVKINGRIITLVCSISIDSEAVIISDDDINFGRVNLTAAGGGKASQESLSFNRVRVTESGIEGKAPDLSLLGGKALFVINNTDIINFYFEPSEVINPHNVRIKIIADSNDKNVAFIKTVVKFDPSKIKLEGEIETSTYFSTVVKKPGIDEINKSGIAAFVIASSPTDSQPSGVFEVANFPISTIPDENGYDTGIDFAVSEMQIVSGDVKELAVISEDAIVSINRDL